MENQSMMNAILKMSMPTPTILMASTFNFSEPIRNGGRHRLFLAPMGQSQPTLYRLVNVPIANISRSNSSAINNDNQSTSPGAQDLTSTD